MVLFQDEIEARIRGSRCPPPKLPTFGTDEENQTAGNAVEMQSEANGIMVPAPEPVLLVNGEQQNGDDAPAVDDSDDEGWK